MDAVLARFPSIIVLYRVSRPLLLYQGLSVADPLPKKKLTEMTSPVAAENDVLQHFGTAAS
jgi:hypothetical protein